MSGSASSPRRGRHQSTCKDGRKTIEWLRKLSGVSGVTIGRTSGRTSVGRGKPVGHLKLQRRTEGGFRAVLMCSYGAQEIFVMCGSGMAEAVREAINARFR